LWPFSLMDLDLDLDLGLSLDSEEESSLLVIWGSFLFLIDGEMGITLLRVR
jgi:hypothetical protein